MAISLDAIQFKSKMIKLFLFINLNLILSIHNPNSVLIANEPINTFRHTEVHMPGTTIYVSSTTELLTALSTVSGGDTIYLRSGNYGDITLANLHFSSTVTLVSEVPQGAIFRSLTIKSSDNIQFDGIELEYIKAPEDASWVSAINISNSTFIDIVNSNLHGSEDGDLNNDISLINIKTSSNILLSNNSIHEAVRGGVISQSDNIQVLNNEIYNIRSDGLDFIGVENVTIRGNSFTDFFPNLAAGDHSDGIQFHTGGAIRDSSNVIIENNTFFQGNGNDFQSIFISSTSEFGFNNFDIVGNIISNGSFHGITVHQGSQINIFNNTVLQAADGANPPGILIGESRGTVLVSNNVSRINLGTSEFVTGSNNIEPQNSDSTLNTYYGNLFSDAFAGATATISSFAAKIGSLLDSGVLIGAVDTSGSFYTTSTLGTTTSDTTTTTLDPVVVADTTTTTTTTDPVVADTTTTTTITDPIVADTTTTTTITDPIVADTTTTTTTTTNTTKTVTDSTVTYETNMVLSIADSTDAAGYTAVGNAVIGADALIFNGKGYVDLGQDANLFGLDAFTLSFDITAGTAKADNKGVVRLIWNQEHYGIEMDGDDIIFRIQTDTGDTQVLRAVGVGANDGQSHTIVMSYDSSTGIMSGYIDNALVVEASGITGSIADATDGTVTVGGGDRGRNFEGEIDNLTVWSDADHTPDATYASASLTVVDTTATDTSATTIIDSSVSSLTLDTTLTTDVGVYNPDDFHTLSPTDTSLL